MMVCQDIERIVHGSVTNTAQEGIIIPAVHRGRADATQLA